MQYRTCTSAGCGMWMTAVQCWTHLSTILKRGGKRRGEGRGGFSAWGSTLTLWSMAPVYCAHLYLYMHIYQSWCPIVWARLYYHWDMSTRHNTGCGWTTPLQWNGNASCSPPCLPLPGDPTISDHHSFDSSLVYYRSTVQPSHSHTLPFTMSDKWANNSMLLHVGIITHLINCYSTAHTVGGDRGSDIDEVRGQHGTITSQKCGEERSSTDQTEPWPSKNRESSAQNSTRNRGNKEHGEHNICAC